MLLAQEAELASFRGDEDEARQLIADAAELESQAAWMLIADLGAEPSRGVLFRSAATLQYRAGNYDEAERLIGAGLSGRPAGTIAGELRDLYEDVTFGRHLETGGIALDSSELQLALAGPAVGYGVAGADVFMKRVSVAEKLLWRTVERRAGRPFREQGDLKRTTKSTYGLYLSTPRGGSFTVTLRVGRPTKQEEVFSDTSEVVRELVENLTHYEAEEFERLEERITDAAYRRSFFGLAAQLAPDGREVNLVGVTARVKGEVKQVPMRTPRSRRRGAGIERRTKRPITVLEIVGELRFADDTRKKRVIKVVVPPKDEVRVAVPAGMMSDVVKPHFGEMVRVYCRQLKNENRLLSIEPAAEGDEPMIVERTGGIGSGRLLLVPHE